MQCTTSKKINFHQKELSVAFRRNIRNIEGTVEQRCSNSETSDGGTVKQLWWTSEKEMVEQ